MEGMTNAQFNAVLETIAKLLEAMRGNNKEAAEVVRSVKTTQ